MNTFVLYNVVGTMLKVPKCEIFDHSDCHDFYFIKSLWEGDFGVKEVLRREIQGLKVNPVDRL